MNGIIIIIIFLKFRDETNLMQTLALGIEYFIYFYYFCLHNANGMIVKVLH